MNLLKHIFKNIFWVLQLTVSIILTVSLYKYLPMKYLVLLCAVLVILLIITTFTQVSNKTNNIVKIGSKILSVVICAALLIANFMYINKASETIAKITDGNIKTTVVSVLVRNDSNYKEIADLDGKQFGILKNIDRENTDFMVNRLSSQLNNKVVKTEYADAEEMLNELLDGKVDAIIMNEGFRDSFELVNPKFESETRVVYQLDREETLENAKGASVTKEPFVVYISGIDTTGPITTTSRSDVNMLMAVNPIRKEVTLVFVPRDYYVALQCPTTSCETGAMDKLTHAGLYGVETSQSTISTLLNVNINYNMRINFDTLTTLVDALGGIDIYSDQDVELLHGEGCNIKQGTQHVNGKCALGFARERYSYEAGDRHRGENQQEVIRAVINKLSAGNVLKNYESIMSAVQGMFQTNMSNDDITALISMQLNDMATWSVNSISVDGTGDMLATYSYGSQPLYVMLPNEESMTTAKQAIENTLK